MSFVRPSWSFRRAALSTVLVKAFMAWLLRFQILFFLFMTIEPSHIRHFSADFYRQPILPAELRVWLKLALEPQAPVLRRDWLRTRAALASPRNASAFPLAFFRVVPMSMIPIVSSSCDGATAGRTGLRADRESRQREASITQGYPEPANK